MAQKQTKTKEVVEEVATKEKVEDTAKQPKKKKSTNFKEDGTFKLNLDAVGNENEPTAEKVDTKDEPKTDKEKVIEEEVKEQPILEEITDEKVESNQEATQPVTTDEVEDTKEEIKETTPGMELPENIQKVVDFMNETGGTLEDYVRLNADYSKVDDRNLLDDYYRQTKPHLSQNERNFLIEDKFDFDEEVDEERDVKRKKLAFKEAVAEARGNLEQMKGKYYDDIKMGSKLPPEQQKAIDFFNRYNKEQDEVKKLTLKQKTHFDKQTGEVFNKEFKGFEFAVDDKKYRYNVKDVNANKEAQSDVLKVFSPYVSKENLLQDAEGYHKSLFAARNPNAIANHFYQQGKTDAIKQLTSDAKNIDMKARKVDSGVIDTGQQQFKVVGGDDSSKLKFKLKNY
tara:strand:- start:818 stop:2011 length:1194 start_codon:yes stop_codon:yes gene_type:complete